LEELLDGYLKATGLSNEPGSLLFPAALGKTKLSRRPLVRTDAAEMFKRRLNKRGCWLTIRLTHSARPASRKFLANDGTLEAARQIARPRRQPNHKAFMTAAVRRYCLKKWSGLDINAPPN
jgi:hypothetical protein